MAVEDDQQGTARVALVGALVVIASFVAGKAARDAILLSNFEITKLPFFVGASAIASLPIVVLVGRLLSRYGPRRLVPVLNTISAMLLVGEWFLYESQAQLGAILIFFHLTLFGAVLVSGFWSIVNERFDATSAKRYIARIGLGATIGGIVGGLLVERAAVYLAPSAILLVLAGLQVICALLQHVLAQSATHVVPPPSLHSGEAIKLVVKTPLLRGLALIVVFGAVAATALDYVFKVEIVEATGDQGPLRFFAIYYTATNILTALSQIVLSRHVLARLGVARSIATLPATVTAASICALALPGLTAIVIARSSEMIVRSSIYRAAYEMVYAPLAEQFKRSTKVILDVGAERIGDLLGAQLVGLMVYLAAPDGALLVAGLVAGLGALAFAMVLPRSYTKALEQSLEVRVADAEADASWSTVGIPNLADVGDLTAMSLYDLRSSTMASPRMTTGFSKTAVHQAMRASSLQDNVLARIGDLRSSDPKRVKRALATALTPELVPHVVGLLAWDQLAKDATTALRAIAPRCSGVLVDTLLDPKQEFSIKRWVPAILEVGEPGLATWGLWRGLSDSRFEVRYRCAKALAKLRATGHELALLEEEVFAAITRELSVDSSVWQDHRLLDPTPHDEVVFDRAREMTRGLEHVFTLLGLALPSGPVRIALQAIGTSDRMLRGTALEYLESVLPTELRMLLWPHVESSGDQEDDELETLVTSLGEDDSAWPTLWAAIEPALTRMVAQPGFLDRRAPREEDCRNIVLAVMSQLRADNFRRLRAYNEARRSNRSRFTSWLRLVAKRVGTAYLRKRAGEPMSEVADMTAPRPSAEIIADLMESHASLVGSTRDDER